MKNLFLVGFFLLLAMPVVLADIDFNGDITPEEKETFDDILEPLMRIYNFVKYSATMIGVLMFAYSGIVFLTAGGDQAKKEKAKQMATGVIIGLILIWVAPLVVGYLVQ